MDTGRDRYPPAPGPVAMRNRRPYRARPMAAGQPERGKMLNNELETWDRNSLFHPSTNAATHARGDSAQRTIVGGEGVYIRDITGRESLDAFAGLYCVNIGYGRQEVAEAIADQARSLAYYHAYAGHASEASITLARMIMERAPEHMARVYFGLSGSDANETNVKLIWYYNNVLDRPEKKKIISRWRGYHGSGLMTGSLTGLRGFHVPFDLPLPYVLHTDAPYYFHREDRSLTEEQFATQCAERLEALILEEGPETIAAFWAEPALGTGGIVPPPATYWEKIQAVLEKYDILLVADEVVTGFGRLGTMFGSTKYGMKPDLITIAKGLTSAYAPLSGSIVSEKLWKVIEEGNARLGPIGHGWTYSAHPLCAAAGVANLKAIGDLNLLANVNEVGPYLLSSLKQALDGVEIVGEVRGDGMLAAVELARDPAAGTLFDADAKVGAKIAAEMLEQDVIARAMPNGDIIGMAPPLCLSKSEADKIVDAVASATRKVAGTL